MSLARSNPWWASVALVSLLLSACGGGGGGGTAPPATGTTPPPVTTKTTYVTGSIAGFGSVIVNGVRYESDSATVSKEGKTASQADLKAGEVITLRAETGSDGVPRAKAIEQRRLLQGTVSAVDDVADTLTVSGIVVQVTAETLFGPGITGGLAGIVVGDRLQINGFVGANGTAVATRVERSTSDDTEIELTGRVTALDANAKRFTLGTQVIDFSTATFFGIAATGPVEGDLVEVKGTALLPDGALKATRVKREDAGLRGGRGDAGDLHGRVTRFVSATDFDVHGQKVTTDAATTYFGGSAGDLKADARIAVLGTLDANGVLLATKIFFKRDPVLELKAAVEAVTRADATSGTVTVLGVTFAVTADTRKEDHVSRNHFFSLADIRTGDWLEVAAFRDPADNTKWIAAKLELVPARTRVELKGPIEQMASPDFRIAGIGITTTGSTDFRNGSRDITAAQFFDLTSINGLRVEVEGTWNGAAPLNASKVRVRPPRLPN